MNENKSETLKIDYFASLSRGNRILKVLHDIPSEKVSRGGCSKQEIEERIAEYTKELFAKGLVSTGKGRGYVRSLDKELNNLKEAGLVLEQNTDGTRLYKLSIDSLFYIHGMYSTISDFKTVTKKDIEQPRFLTPSTPGAILLDEIVLAPASITLIGEHGVLLGRPAVALPIPIFLAIHATVSKYTGPTVVHCFAPDLDFSCKTYAELSCFPGLPVPIYRISDSSFRFKLLQVERLFISKLKKVHKEGYYIVLQIRSQIPPCVGLGSSGALCAALAILLDRIINPEETNPLIWRKENPDRLLKGEVSQFNKIFLNAVEFEREIHGKTSGVGPFASLVGDDCFTPIWYELGSGLSNKETFVMNEILDQKKDEDEVKLNLKCMKGSAKAQEYLSNEMGLAAVYTTQSRRDIKATLSDDEFIKALKRGDCRRDFVATTKKLWKNLCVEHESRRADDMEDVITCINLFGEYEEGYLKMLRNESEAIARELIYRLRGAGLGAKYTGAGFGGDIILIGSKEKLKTMLIPNYYPVHYTNITLTYQSPEIDWRACPKIVQKNDFASNLLPKFLNRAVRT
ncbi:MAG: hypothetical protein QXQ64_08945 [Candidatus Bathyarchaeia archaeon]